jgi:hypothetical protein
MARWKDRRRPTEMTGNGVIVPDSQAFGQDQQVEVRNQILSGEA